VFQCDPHCHPGSKRTASLVKAVFIRRTSNTICTITQRLRNQMRFLRRYHYSSFSPCRIQLAS
jgi:hypothetical protein